MIKKKPKIIANLKLRPGIRCSVCQQDLLTECPHCKNNQGTVIFNSLIDENLQIGFMFRTLSEEGEVIIQSHGRFKSKMDTLVSIAEKLKSKKIDIEIEMVPDMNSKTGQNITARRATIKFKNGR